jgi:ubiquinone/menaquinone biosynthesis C-methylase UbiE
LDIFFEIHKDLPREGPGNNNSTRKAFSLLKNLPSNPRILDIGCGPGMQTIELAKLSNGKIIGIDTHKPFLDELNRRAEKEGVQDRIETIICSMFSMDFEDEFFDLIWSEGAIFIIGFEKGLKEWHRFLRKRGYIVVSELAWLRGKPPQETNQYLKKEYPPIKTIEENMQIIKRLGYHFLKKFILPESGWWDDYYVPLENRISLLRKKYQGDTEAEKALDETLIEIEMFRKYSAYYGYVFYLMQKK